MTKKQVISKTPSKKRIIRKIGTIYPQNKKAYKYITDFLFSNKQKEEEKKHTNMLIAQAYDTGIFPKYGFYTEKLENMADMNTLDMAFSQELLSCDRDIEDVIIEISMLSNNDYDSYNKYVSVLFSLFRNRRRYGLFTDSDIMRYESFKSDIPFTFQDSFISLMKEVKKINFCYEGLYM